MTMPPTRTERQRNEPRSRSDKEDWTDTAAWSKRLNGGETPTGAALSAFFGPGHVAPGKPGGGIVAATLSGMSTFQRLSAAMSFAAGHRRDPGGLSEMFGHASALRAEDEHGQLFRALHTVGQHQAQALQGLRRMGLGMVPDAHSRVLAPAHQYLGSLAPKPATAAPGTTNIKPGR